MLAGIFYQLFLVVSSSKKNKETHSVYKRRSAISQKEALLLEEDKVKPAEFMVILTNFTQIFSIFAAIGLDTILSVVNTSQPVANPSKQALLSFKCIFYKHVSTPFQALQIETLLFVFSPIAKLLAFSLYEVFRMIFKKCREPTVKIAVRLGTAAVVLTLLEQPGIIGSLSNYLSCNRIDPYVNNEYVKLPNSVERYMPEYIYFRNVAVIPAILFWGVAVPFTIFLILYKKRRLLPFSENLYTVFSAPL